VSFVVKKFNVKDIKGGNYILRWQNLTHNTFINNAL